MDGSRNVVGSIDGSNQKVDAGAKRQKADEADLKMEDLISLHSRQEGFPIYKTKRNPVTYAAEYDHNLIYRDQVHGVKGAFVLHDVLTSSECDQFVQITESMGYEGAPITTSRGMVMRPDIRNNKRVIWHTDGKWLLPIFERIYRHLPRFTEVRNWRWNLTEDHRGLNERLRFYRYDPGESFNKHYDGAHERSENECSLASLIIYLNDSCLAGHTTFYPGGLKVSPRQGSALIFWHGEHPLSPLHEGSDPEQGRKYVLRSDIMYTRQTDWAKRQAEDEFKLPGHDARSRPGSVL